MSLAERAKKLIEKKQDLFIALEEMDRTGKLSKLRYKKRQNFTIDEELMKKFREYCKKKGIKMSTKIEELIKRELKQ